MKITLYHTETYDGGYRDWYRPIVPHLNIGFADLDVIVFRKVSVLQKRAELAPVSPTPAASNRTGYFLLNGTFGHVLPYCPPCGRVFLGLTSNAHPVDFFQTYQFETP